jgi:glyoxylate reductase
VDLETLLRESDFISLHAASDRQIIGPEELALVKPSAVLVNCARGVLVDNRAAYRAVAEGRLFGYGLDEVWRYPDLPLEGLNIVVSPHVGSDTDLGKANMQRFSTQAVVEYFSGQLPRNALNPSVFRSDS